LEHLDSTPLTRTPGRAEELYCGISQSLHGVLVPRGPAFHTLNYSSENDRSEWAELRSESHTSLFRSNETRETKDNVLNEKQRAARGIRNVLDDDERTMGLGPKRDTSQRPETRKRTETKNCKALYVN
jgi:hypothetical protein